MNKRTLAKEQSQSPRFLGLLLLKRILMRMKNHLFYFVKTGYILKFEFYGRRWSLLLFQMDKRDWMLCPFFMVLSESTSVYISVHPLLSIIYRFCNVKIFNRTVKDRDMKWNSYSPVKPCTVRLFIQRQLTLCKGGFLMSRFICMWSHSFDFMKLVHTQMWPCSDARNTHQQYIAFVHWCIF